MATVKDADWALAEKGARQLSRLGEGERLRMYRLALKDLEVQARGLSQRAEEDSSELRHWRIHFGSDWSEHLAELELAAATSARALWDNAEAQRVLREKIRELGE